jgi:hypothetical protein
MPRANLLIADDVGLGKTIETGLVILELILRHRARTVLVVCPSALQIQWRDQMRDKFGLDFVIVDSKLFCGTAPEARPAGEPLDALPAPDHLDRFPEARPPSSPVPRRAASPGDPTFPRASTSWWSTNRTTSLLRAGAVSRSTRSARPRFALSLRISSTNCSHALSPANRREPLVDLFRRWHGLAPDAFGIALLTAAIAEEERRRQQSIELVWTGRIRASYRYAKQSRSCLI